MAVIYRKLILLPFFILCFVNLQGKQDTTKTILLGLESGYFSYTSIDDIFIPFAYSGGAAFYSFNKIVIKKSVFRQLNITYAFIDRKPVSLNLRSSYTILRYDEGLSSVWETDPKYLEVKTNIAKIESKYLIKTPIQFLPNDLLYIGVVGNIDAIFRAEITNPELVSFTINPGILYRLPIKKIFNLALQSNINLAGISFRKSYADAEAQVTNNYNFNYFKDYFFNHLQFDLINKYFKTTSSITIDKKNKSKF